MRLKKSIHNLGQCASCSTNNTQLLETCEELVEVGGPGGGEGRGEGGRGEGGGGGGEGRGERGGEEG